MTGLQSLIEDARTHHGVTTTAKALGFELTHRRVEHLVSTGYFVRAARGVLVAAGSPPTWKQSVMVAVAAAGPGAAASHQSAAFLHGLVDKLPASIEVVMARWDRAEQDFVVHESKDLIDSDITECDAIAITTPIRTVVDLGATAPWLVEWALERGIRQGRFTLAEVEELVKRVARRGRRGVGAIRPLLQERMRYDIKTESELEYLFLKAWGERRPSPRAQHTILDAYGEFVCRTDFAFVEDRVRIELDSEAFHMDRPTFRKDRRVQNQTELLGWRTLRYTWWDLVNRPEAVVQEVIRSLQTPVLA